MHRVLAMAVAVAAILVLVGLASGPWATATFSDGEVSVDLSGDIDVDPAAGPVAEALTDGSPQRSALQESVRGALPQLVQVMAVLMVVIAVVGAVLDLTPGTWTLVSAVALSCLVSTVILRDRAVSGLTTVGAQLGLGELRTATTGRVGLTIGAAAVATLAAILAAAPRPARTDVGIDQTPADAGDAGTGGDVAGIRGRLPWPPRGRGTQQLPPP